MDTKITMNKGNFYHLMRNIVPYSWTKVDKSFMIIEDSTLTMKVTFNSKAYKPHVITVPVSQEGPNVQCAFYVDDFKKIKTTKARLKHNYTIRVTDDQVISTDFKVPFAVEECPRDTKMTPLAEFTNHEIKDVLAGVSTCVETEEYERIVLQGVHVQRNSYDEIGFAGADGFRLAVGKLTDTSTYRRDFDFIMPTHTVKTLVDYLSRVQRNDQIVVELWESTKSVGFRVINVVKQWRSDEVYRNLVVSIRSDKMRGTFPRYNLLIPTDPKSAATFNALITLAFCEASRKFVDKDSSPIIRFRFGREEDKVEMFTKYQIENYTYRTPDADLKAVLDMKDYRHDAEDKEYYRVALNNNLLQPIIESIIPLSSEMIWEGEMQATPVIIRPVGTECLMFVVMPMFVQWPD